MSAVEQLPEWLVGYRCRLRARCCLENVSYGAGYLWSLKERSWQAVGYSNDPVAQFRIFGALAEPPQTILPNVDLLDSVTLGQLKCL
jgi:hypothetical protein